MYKAKKQIWRDNTEPPKNYIWERLNDSGSYIGTYEFNGCRWVKIRNSNSSVSPGENPCTCKDKYVTISNSKNVVYATDSNGSQVQIPYLESVSKNTIVQRTSDGRIKSKEAKESGDVLTFNDLVWHE